MIAYDHDRDCGWLPGYYRYHGETGHHCRTIECPLLATIARRVCALCAQPIGYSRCYVRPPDHFRFYHTDCVDTANGTPHQTESTHYIPVIPKRPPAYGSG